MVLTESGHVFSWDLNSYGQLGLGTNESKQTDKSFGNWFFRKESLSLATNGDLYGFRSDGFWQLGYSEESNPNSEVSISSYLTSNTFGNAYNSSTYSYCLKSPQKISDLKFSDISTNFTNNISIGISQTGYAIVWGDAQFGVIENPIKTHFKSINGVSGV
jgi:alpha-tubulin suppressor-like RCC1 family protein